MNKFTRFKLERTSNSKLATNASLASLIKLTLASFCYHTLEHLYQSRQKTIKREIVSPRVCQRLSI